jgi:NADH-quinone oxidoreductase subunit M
MNFPILSFITFFPVAGAVLLIFVPKEKTNLHRYLALAFTLVTFLASLALYFNFDGAVADPQFVEKSGWGTGLTTISVSTASACGLCSSPPS